jgi:phage host-nuclease inhibitor protein Gam
MTTMELAEHLTADIDPSGIAKEHYRILGDREALWAMRKLNAIRLKQFNNTDLANEEVQRIRQWEEEVNGPLDNDATYFENLLIDYAFRCRVDENDGRKSIKTAAGTVKTRLGSPSVRVEDKDAFIEWAQSNAPDLVRTKVEVDIAAVKEAAVVEDTTVISADGEIIPGLSVHTPELSATIDLGK